MPYKDRMQRRYLILVVETDALQGDNLACFPVLRLVDNAVGALAKLFDLLVSIHREQKGLAEIGGGVQEFNFYPRPAF